MPLPTEPDDSQRSGTRQPSRIFGGRSTDYDLYEKDGEFVLSIEMPGFEVDDIQVGWDEGLLTVAAHRSAEEQKRQRTYRRQFRMPREVDEDEIRARYQNGILDVYLPTMEGPEVSGTEIPIETE
ncbi:MAG: Hsp20/alpha crystallin family protein [Halodesulfurarchaeum sp.]